MNLARRSFAILSALLAAHTTGFALTVRIGTPAGAPRIVVDGRPVRARMFWGAPGTRPLSLAQGSQALSCEFSARVDEPASATMHLRFGRTAGEVILDDIRVTDLDTGRDLIPTCDFEGGQEDFTRDWAFWPTDEQNTVGTVTVTPGIGRAGSAGLRVSLRAPADGKWPDFHVYHKPNLALVRGHHYRVQMWVDAEPARDLVLHFTRPGTWDTLGGPGDVFTSQIRLAADVGVDFVSFPVPLPWPPPGQPVDWRAVDAACDNVLLANPRALLLPRIGMEPPDWWRAAHPDEVMGWEPGTTPADLMYGAEQGAVVASPLYRRDAAERLAALVAHLEERFGDHVAGYHPAGQHTGEWFYHNSWGRVLSGYAPADLAGWRVWLKQRYGGDEALRQAWGDPAASCGTAEVPSPAARHAAPAGVFRDPTAERPLIDFADYRQDAMAELVCDLARAVRGACRTPKLVVFFYGYNFEFGALGTEPSVSGHYALRKVLSCPDVDVLCSPISYFDRAPGGSAPAMSTPESVALAGKLWLNEDDTATYLAPQPDNHPVWVTGAKTPEGTNALLVRNVAQEALRNFGTWWMDLSCTGQFDAPGMWHELTRLKALDEELLRRPTAFRPEVAAVVDERSLLRMAAGSAVVGRPGLYEVRAPLGRLGAPYGQYLMDDVVAKRVNAKLYVFLTPWCLSAGEREALQQATEGAGRLWCYAPGYLDEYKTSLDAMRQLTGFALQPVSPAKATATPTEAGKALGLQQAFGVDGPVRPLFAASDATAAETLATYPDGSAAVALRSTGQGFSLFVGAPGLTSELLRLAASRAGVHLFTRTDCNVYANGPFVAVHAAQDGPVELELAHAGAVRDALTGETVGEGPHCSINLKRGETRVLRY